MASAVEQNQTSESSSEDSDATSSSSEDEDEELNNVFSEPWKKSDVVLVVNDTDLHVHRSTLIMQSPVFEAMLNGHFLEAKQKKITLKGKTVEDMVRFLKLLYPANMFSSSFSLDDENLIRMLELADEFQAEAVIKQCLEEAAVTPKSATELLPFACKYNQSVRKRCVKVCQRSVLSKALKKSIPSLDSNVIPEIFTGKCDLLEKTLKTASVYLLKSMKHFAPHAVSPKTCCFSHTVDIRDFHSARNCRACMMTYIEYFCEIYAKKVAKCDCKDLVQLFKDIDDLLGQKSPLSFRNLKKA